MQFKVDVCITFKVIETHSNIKQTTRLQKVKIHMIKAKNEETTRNCFKNYIESENKKNTNKLYKNILS